MIKIIMLQRNPFILWKLNYKHFFQQSNETERTFKLRDITKHKVKLEKKMTEYLKLFKTNEKQKQ